MFKKDLPCDYNICWKTLAESGTGVIRRIWIIQEAGSGVRGKITWGDESGSHVVNGWMDRIIICSTIAIKNAKYFKQSCLLFFVLNHLTSSLLFAEQFYRSCLINQCCWQLRWAHCRGRKHSLVSCFKKVPATILLIAKCHGKETQCGDDPVATGLSDIISQTNLCRVQHENFCHKRHNLPIIQFKLI